MAEIRANGVPDELMQRIDTERSKRGRLKIREATIQAFEQWLGSPPVVTTASPSGFASSRHAEWHRLLDIILDHGTQEDVIGIQANLKWGAGAVEGRAASSGRRRKVSNG